MFRVEGLLGELRKHRDYEHDTFFAHEMDNGGWTILDRARPVRARYHPIHEGLLSPSKKYHFLDFGLHSGDEYVFLIPAESDGSPPTEDTIKDTVNETVSTPVVGGRDWFNYLDLDDDDTINHPRVSQRIDSGDTQETPRLARQSPFYSFWDEFEKEE